MLFYSRPNITPVMKKTAVITALVAFVSIIFLPGCNLSSLREGFDKEDGKKVLAKAQFDRVFVDSTAELQVYASMNRSDELKNEDATLRFADPYKEIYLLVFKENVADFKTIVESGEETKRQVSKSFSWKPPPPDTSLITIYGELTTGVATKKLENGRDSLLTEKMLHGMQYRAYAMTGSYKKIPLFYLKGVYKSNRYFYQVVVWTLARRRNLYEGVMTKMIESLQEESSSE